MEGKIGKLSEDVVGCVQDVMGKNNFPFQFEDRHKKDMGSVSLSYVCLKDEVCLEIDEPISELPPKEQGVLLTIDGYPIGEECNMFERGVYYSMF